MKQTAPYRIGFFAKKKLLVDDAIHLLQIHFDRVDLFIGEVGDPFPQQALRNTYDYIISYLSPWILPKDLLNSVQIAQVNLHPGDPRYPGIGCTNFALYNGEKEYGITAHYMAEKVDSGPIILVERFPIFPEDTVYTLTIRCYVYIFVAFTKLLPFMLAGQVF